MSTSQTTYPSSVQEDVVTMTTGQSIAMTTDQHDVKEGSDLPLKEDILQGRLLDPPPSADSASLFFCRLCKGLYRRPKLLSCLHSFSLSCLSALPITPVHSPTQDSSAAKHGDPESNPGNPGDALDKDNHVQDPPKSSMNVISCPICGAKTPIPEGGIEALPDNLLLERLTNQYAEEVKCNLQKDQGTQEPTTTNTDASKTGNAKDTETGKEAAMAAIRHASRLQSKVITLQSEALRITSAIEDVSEFTRDWQTNKQDVRKSISRRCESVVLAVRSLERRLLARVDGGRDGQVFRAADAGKAELRACLKAVLHEVRVLKGVQELGTDAEINDMAESLLGPSVGLRQVAMPTSRYRLELPGDSIEDRIQGILGELQLVTQPTPFFTPSAMMAPTTPSSADVTEGAPTSVFADTSFVFSTGDRAVSRPPKGKRTSPRGSSGEGLVQDILVEDEGEEDTKKIEESSDQESSKETLKPTVASESIPSNEEDKTKAQQSEQALHKRAVPRVTRRHRSDLGLSGPKVSEFLEQMSAARESLADRRREILRQGQLARERSLSRDPGQRSLGRDPLEVSGQRERSPSRERGQRSRSTLGLIQRSQRSPREATQENKNVMNDEEGDDIVTFRFTAGRSRVVSSSSSPTQEDDPTSPRKNERESRGTVKSPSSSSSPLSPSHSSSSSSSSSLNRPRRSISSASDKREKIEQLRDSWQKRKEILIQNEGFVRPKVETLDPLPSPRSSTRSPSSLLSPKSPLDGRENISKRSGSTSGDEDRQEVRPPRRDGSQERGLRSRFLSQRRQRRTDLGLQTPEVKDFINDVTAPDRDVTASQHGVTGLGQDVTATHHDAYAPRHDVTSSSHHYVTASRKDATASNYDVTAFHQDVTDSGKDIADITRNVHVSPNADADSTPPHSAEAPRGRPATRAVRTPSKSPKTSKSSEIKSEYPENVMISTETASFNQNVIKRNDDDKDDSERIVAKTEEVTIASDETIIQEDGETLHRDDGGLNTAENSLLPNENTPNKDEHVTKIETVNVPHIKTDFVSVPFTLQDNTVLGSGEEVKTLPLEQGPTITYHPDSYRLENKSSISDFYTQNNEKQMAPDGYEYVTTTEVVCLPNVSPVLTENTEYFEKKDDFIVEALSSNTSQNKDEKCVSSTSQKEIENTSDKANNQSIQSTDNFGLVSNEVIAIASKTQDSSDKTVLPYQREPNDKEIEVKEAEHSTNDNNQFVKEKQEIEDEADAGNSDDDAYETKTEVFTIPLPSHVSMSIKAQEAERNSFQLSQTKTASYEAASQISQHSEKEQPSYPSTYSSTTENVNTPDSVQYKNRITSSDQQPNATRYSASSTYHTHSSPRSTYDANYTTQQVKTTHQDTTTNSNTQAAALSPRGSNPRPARYSGRYSTISTTTERFDIAKMLSAMYSGNEKSLISSSTSVNTDTGVSSGTGSSNSSNNNNNNNNNDDTSKRTSNSSFSLSRPTGLSINTNTSQTLNPNVATEKENSRLTSPLSPPREFPKGPLSPRGSNSPLTPPLRPPSHSPRSPLSPTADSPEKQKLREMNREKRDRWRTMHLT